MISETTFMNTRDIPEEMKGRILDESSPTEDDGKSV